MRPIKLDYFLSFLTLIFGLLNIFLFSKFFFPYNLMLFLIICVLYGFLLVRIILKSLLLLNENNNYLILYMVLPIFCYIPFQTASKTIVIFQLIIAAIVFPTMHCYSLLKANSAKTISKKQIQYIKLVNITLISINSLAGSMLFLSNEKFPQVKIKIILIPLISSLLIQRVCIEYINYKNM